METAVITAENQFTLPVVTGRLYRGEFTVSAYASAGFVGTISIQYRHENETAWRNFNTTLTGEDAVNGELKGERWVVRAGCRAGDFTAGQITIEVSA